MKSQFPISSTDHIIGSAESFNERVSRWEMAFESILIEIEQERSKNGLALHIDIGEFVPERCL